MFVIKTPSEDVPCETLDDARRVLADYADRMHDAGAIREVTVIQLSQRHRRMTTAIDVLASSEIAWR